MHFISYTGQRYHNCGASGINSPNPNIRGFAAYAVIILTIPASEAAFKRLFAHLGTIYNSTSCNMDSATLNSRLAIRMHKVLEDAKHIEDHRIQIETQRTNMLTNYADQLDQYCKSIV